MTQERKAYLKLDLESSVIKGEDVLDALTVTFSMILTVPANKANAKEALECMPDDYLGGIIEGCKEMISISETIQNERKIKNEESKTVN